MPEKVRAELKTIIRNRALEVGFDVVRFTTADPDPSNAKALNEFISQGRQGDMAWLNNKDGRRGNPLALMPEAKTIIMLGANYGPNIDPIEIQNKNET